MDFFENIEAVEQDSGVGFGSVSVFVADDAFEFAKTHAVGIRELRLFVNAVALFKGGPERLVAHNDGINDTIGVEGELVLAENAEFAGADDVAFLGVELAGEDLHEGGLAGAVGAREAVATAGDEADAYIFKEDFGAVAHGDVADTKHDCWFLNLIPVAVHGPQVGGGRSGPNPDRLIEDWDAGPNFPGLIRRGGRDLGHP